MLAAATITSFSVLWKRSEVLNLASTGYTEGTPTALDERRQLNRPLTTNPRSGPMPQPMPGLEAGVP
ncbi:hypothetical protein V496_07627 [Pseudogymnoascus sp. VKM F-4515 (FW-2607)]|nr:hypothetical protein V496_07627 [Pseudogymnoascus sp. VKM F-4515 (FW-2607)]